MNFSPVDQLESVQKALDRQSPEALRKVATQFEAVLLMQLTSALSQTTESSGDDGDEPLFGGDGGTGLAKQMFAEQLATTMAQAGGVGLAETLMRQFGVEPTMSYSGQPKGLAGAVSEVKYIKAEGTAKTSQAIDQVELSKEATFSVNPQEAEVVSTFEAEARKDGIDESLRNLILDGKIVNTTRPRVARKATLTEPFSSISGSNAPSEPLTYQLPVSGALSSGFGNRVHPIDHRVKFHAGLDLAIPRGTKVEASADGVVSFASWSGGYGNLMIIRHPDGRETRYGHLDRLDAAVGDQVVAGQAIALSGSTGRSTGPHLHFEIRENGQVLNPLNILTKDLPKTAEK